MTSLALCFATAVAVLSLTQRPCLCWDQEELDLFDLVEEVGVDFYDLMQLHQDASTAEIRRAYRHLSLQLHPDKSDDPNAAEKFRKMVAVYEVLKDEVKREMYDIILEEGLPDWKEPLFYYRKMRKMGFMELTIMLLMALSVGHYLYGWAVYVEKKIVLQDRLNRKQKKEQRKSRHGKSSQSHQRLEAEVEMLNSEAQACIPHFKDLLPILMAKNIFWLSLLCFKLLHKKWEIVLSTPKEEKKDVNSFKKVRLTPCKIPVGSGSGSGSGSESDGMELNNGRVKAAEDSSLSRTHASKEDGDTCVHKPAKGSTLNCALSGKGSSDTGNIRTKCESNGRQSTGIHTDDASKDRIDIDKTEECLNPCVNEEDTLSKGSNSVAKAAAIGRRKMKTTVKDLYQHFKVPTESVEKASVDVSSDTELNGSSDSPVKANTSSSPPVWSQFQQKQLEMALAQYPKFSSNRWINIARCVPGKSQDECVDRCKQLSEELKQKKPS